MRAVARGCSWEPAEEDKWYKYNFGYRYRDILGYGDFSWADSVRPNLQISDCQAPAASGDRWLLRRLGPLISHGGYDWHMLAHNSTTREQWPALQTLLREWPEVWILGAWSMATDAACNLFEYPPLHDHHTMIKLAYNTNETIIFNHHDRACEDPALGYKCQYTRWPEGYGALLNQSLNFQGFYNDVRVNNSEPLEWYIEFGVLVSKDGKAPDGRPLTSTREWETGHYRPSLESAYTGRVKSFPVPAGKSSVTWTHTVVQVTGDVVGQLFWLHTHEGLGHKQTWLFNAAPDELGLNEDPFVLPVCGMFEPGNYSMTLEDVQHHVLTYAQASQSPLRCVATVCAYAL